MPLSKYLPLLITSFLLTITLLYFPTTTNYSPRQLLSLSETNSICDKSQSNILERYISKDFTYIPNNKSKSEDLISFVQKPSKHNFVNYLPRILIFSICILIGLLLIIGWFFYCCCCCCPGCCCKHISTHSPGYCGETSLVILLILYGMIIAMSVTNLGLSAKLQEGMNGTSCALFKLYDTIMNGEKEYIQRPRWEGIEDIITKLTETQMYLNTISFDAAKSEAALEEIKKSKDSVLEDINKLDKYVIELKSNHSDLIEKYLFLYSYTNLSDSRSMLGKFYNEYLIHIDKPYELLLESQEVFANLYSNKTSFINALESSITSINEIQVLLNELSSELLDKWYDIQIKINSYGIFVYYILSILFIVIGVLGFVSAFLYSCNQCHHLGVSIHITWNLLSLFSIIGIIIGSCFGIVGIVGTDSIGLFQYIFKDNLYSDNRLIFSNKTNSFELIDICFNKNGQIEQALGLKELMTPLNQVFNLSKYLNESYSNVNEYMFPVISQIKRNYTYIQYSSYWIRNKYAQLKILLEYQDQKWLFKEDKCLFGDVICRDISCMNNTETCFYFEDWIDENKEADFEQIITESVSTSGKYSEAIKEVFDYAKSVNAILDETFEKNEPSNEQPTIVDTMRTMHSSILGSIIGEEGGEGNSALKYMIGNEIEIRKKMSDDIYNMYENWLGVKAKNGNEKDVNVFEILNCRFMKFNFESLLEQIENGLSKKAFNCGVVLLVISFVGFVSNIFALIVINKFQLNPNTIIDNNNSDSYVMFCLH